MGPSIYVGGQTGQRADVYSGDAIATYVKGYCHSGAVTFENCGAQTIYDRDMTISGSLARNFEYPPGLGPCNGDSGAPVYRWYFGDVKIVGIIKGGPNFNAPELGGNGDEDLDPFELDNCHAHSSEAWVTTWTQIRDAYNVTIKTI